ncbi:MAG: hypothetical protein GDA39_08785 [Hyphomonadaceae bacterium]|nr:hypothetical protein [Hyphomonadaceae bacterium]MBC6412944.1 hypothetical protein [Hyphomonadaceae bacterium]
MGTPEIWLGVLTLAVAVASAFIGWFMSRIDKLETRLEKLRDDMVSRDNYESLRDETKNEFSDVTGRIDTLFRKE